VYVGIPEVPNHLHAKSRTDIEQPFTGHI